MTAIQHSKKCFRAEEGITTTLFGADSLISKTYHEILLMRLRRVVLVINREACRLPAVVDFRKEIDPFVMSVHEEVRESKLGCGITLTIELFLDSGGQQEGSE